MTVRLSCFVLAACAAAALSGCNFNSYVYRPDVHQGNLITSEMISQLENGMTQAQVQFLLGEPLIRSALHQNRWDYTYYKNPRRGDIEMRHVAVFFDEDGRLVRVEHDPLPTEQEADQTILNSKKK